MLKDIIVISIASLSGSFILFATIFYIRKELKNWNKGYCDCGGKWTLDRWNWDGERIYVCPHCKKNIEISYKFIDKN